MEGAPEPIAPETARPKALPTGRVYAAAALLIFLGVLKSLFLAQLQSGAEADGVEVPGFVLGIGLVVAGLTLGAGIAASFRRAYGFALAVPGVFAVLHLLLGFMWPWLADWFSFACWSVVFLLLNSAPAAFRRGELQTLPPQTSSESPAS